MSKKLVKRSLPNLVRLILTAVMLGIATLGSWSPAAASDHVEPGFVPLSMDNGVAVFDFIPIGDDFFFAGSQQPTGSVALRGLAFDTGTYGDAAIQIDIPSLEHDPGTPISGPVTITQLGLGPTVPIVIRNADGSIQQEWIFEIMLSPQVPQNGTLNVLESHPNGGSFNLELPFVPRMTFTNVDSGETRELDFGLMTQPFTIHLQGSSSWARTCPERLHVAGETSNFCPGTNPATGDTFFFPLRDILNGALNLTVERTAAPVAPNRPPVLSPIGNMMMTEVNQLARTIGASDPDGHNLTFSATGLPGFCMLTDRGNGTAFLLCSPVVGDAGNYTITFTVTDDGSPPLSDSETVILTVIQANRPPELEPIGPLVAREGTTTTFTFAATDPDGDNLTFSIQNAPSYSQFVDNGDGTATFSVTPPTGSAPDTSDVTVTVTDDGSPPLSDSTTFQLTVVQGNRPPLIDATELVDTELVESISSQPGEFFFEIGSSDPDGDNRSFSATGLSGFCTLTDNGDGTAFISCVPSLGSAGRDSITVTVTDDGDPPLSASHTFTLVIKPYMEIDDDPDIVNQGEPATLTATCSNGLEPQGRCSSVTWDLDADGEFDDASGSPVTVDTSDWALGDKTIAAQGCIQPLDEEPLCNTAETTINVQQGNRPPVIDQVDDVEVVEGEELFGTITATDPDGNTITFDTVLPDFCTFTDNGDGTGTFVCNPKVGDHGTYEIVVVARDDGTPPKASVMTFTLTVKPQANAGGPYDVVQGQSTTLNASAPADTDGQFTYSWDIVGDGQFDDAMGQSVSFDATNLDPGVYPVAVKVCTPDDVCNTAGSTVNVLPADSDQPPSFDGLRNLVRDNVSSPAVKFTLLLALNLAEFFDRVGALTAAERALETFIRLVERFTPRFISPEAAERMIQAAEELFDYLFD